MTLDRTNIVATIGLAILTPLLVAASADPRLAKYALYIVALRSALSDIGFLFTRDNKVSDQQAKAREVDPATGAMVNASDIAK